MQYFPHTTTPLALLITVLLFCEINAASFPQNVDDALLDYPRRRNDITEVFADLTRTVPLTYSVLYTCPSNGQDPRPLTCVKYESHPFGAFNEHGSTKSFRRMTGALLAYKSHYSDGSLSSVINTPSMVFNWTRTIHKFARTGTDTGGGEADYDMGKTLASLKWNLLTRM
jgi:hypothetical protein